MRRLSTAECSIPTCTVTKGGTIIGRRHTPRGRRTLVLVDEGRGPPPRSTRRLVDFLEGKSAGYPEQAFRREFEPDSAKGSRRSARTRPPRTLGLRTTRSAITRRRSTLYLRVVMGGISPGNRGTVLHCRVRYFDPEARRAGLPPDVAALVEGITASSTTLRSRQPEPDPEPHRDRPVRRICRALLRNGLAGRPRAQVGGPCFKVRLAPGCGGKLVLGVRRYVNVPTLSLPWDR